MKLIILRTKIILLNFDNKIKANLKIMKKLINQKNKKNCNKKMKGDK